MDLTKLQSPAGGFSCIPGVRLRRPGASCPEAVLARVYAPRSSALDISHRFCAFIRFLCAVAVLWSTVAPSDAP